VAGQTGIENVFVVVVEQGVAKLPFPRRLLAVRSTKNILMHPNARGWKVALNG
jgi:hypothetical protein